MPLKPLGSKPEASYPSRRAHARAVASQLRQAAAVASTSVALTLSACGGCGAPESTGPEPVPLPGAPQVTHTDDGARTPGRPQAVDPGHGSAGDEEPTRLPGEAPATHGDQPSVGGEDGARMLGAPPAIMAPDAAAPSHDAAGHQEGAEAEARMPGQAPATGPGGVVRPPGAPPPPASN